RDPRNSEAGANPIESGSVEVGAQEDGDAEEANGTTEGDGQETRLFPSEVTSR
ncbi:MAG: hypothetical protein QOI81_1691, partial [Actinomycetota bacterium]|nr:hypothetical protein [Actinomycetota bacterium]